MSGREPIAGADNAWRRMGTASNLMTITGVMTFEQHVGYEELCDRLEQRLLRFARFKQRIGGEKRMVRRPYWEEMASLDVRTHVYDIALPEPADKATFERFIGSLVSRPLDESRPLWEAYLLDNAGSGDGNAVAFRINHSIGDGFALLSVLLGLVDNPGDIDLPMSGVPDPPTVSESGAASTEGTARDSSFSLPSVSEAVDIALDGGKYAVQGAKSGYGLLTMDEDPRTSLHQDIGTRKHVAWTDEMDLDTIKAIGRAHDTTVNDVLLGATAGGFRRLFEQREELTEDMQVTCTVPVNLKGMDGRDDSLGNHFGLAFIPLPVGTRDLDERIERIRKQTTRERLGTEAFLLYQLLRVGGHVPFAIQELVMDYFAGKTMGVFTNVPGPTQRLELGGTEISDIMFWVPQSLDQGIGISIFSYAGGVRVGVNCDDNLLSDPQTLTDAFETEVEMLADNLE